MAGTKLNSDTTVGFLTCGELEFCTKEYKWIRERLGYTSLWRVAVTQWCLATPCEYHTVSSSVWGCLFNSLYSRSWH